jgi:hypothetical protein
MSVADQNVPDFDLFFDGQDVGYGAGIKNDRSVHEKTCHSARGQIPAETAKYFDSHLRASENELRDFPTN